mgnify:CR=1 FL=1
MKLLILLPLFLSTFIIQAKTFTITNRYYRPSSNAYIISDYIDNIYDDLEDSVNNSMISVDTSIYLKGVSESTALASKGLSASYANDFDLFILMGAVGAAADLGSYSLNDAISGDVNSDRINGVGVATAATFGLNLNFFPLPTFAKRFKLYASFMKTDLDFDDFSTKIEHMALFVQYRLIEEENIGSSYLLNWGGVDVTLGLEKTTLDLNYSKALVKSLTQLSETPLGTANFTGTYSGTPSASLESSITSIPVEISTSVRFLYFLSLYGGLGFDLVSGETTASSNATGSISMTDDGGIINDGDVSATPNFSLGQSGKPSSTNSRFFGGLQINGPLLSVFMQYNEVFGGVKGAAVGVKVRW